MDLTKLSTGDKVIAGSGIVLFISSFLTWFKYDYSGFGISRSITQNGWDYFWTGGLPVLLGLLLIGYIVVTKLVEGVELPELPVGWPIVVLGTAGLAALLVLIRLLVGGDDQGTDLLKRSFGLFIAVLAVIGLAAGAFLKFQEEGGDLKNLKKGSSGTGTGAGQGGSPTPF